LISNSADTESLEQIKPSAKQDRIKPTQEGSLANMPVYQS